VVFTGLHIKMLLTMIWYWNSRHCLNFYHHIYISAK